MYMHVAGILFVFTQHTHTHHTGRGVPNTLQIESSRLAPLQNVPSTIDAAQSYRSQGGNLTQFGLFGADPLCNRPDLIRQRETYFVSSHPSFDDIFSNVVTGDGLLFQEAVIDYIRITKSLQISMVVYCSFFFYVL